jgi:hypothetical protein
VRSYLLILGERQALAWVLREERMAFAPGRSRQAMGLRPCDGLFIYTSRGCFNNPTRDRGRVIGEATVEAEPRLLDEPVDVAGRDYSVTCELSIANFAPLHEGVELAPLVNSMAVFHDKHTWAIRLRQTLLALPAADASLLRLRLKGVVRPRAEGLGGYVAIGTPVTPTGSSG